MSEVADGDLDQIDELGCQLTSWKSSAGVWVMRLEGHSDML